ncbi:MAG: hypothetical protein PHP20_01790 [Firmicutes bacterium]|jgi:uncharacterized protein (UPF0332 family)|nr:hypothetical protein [Bacillota bacterium]MDD4337902.1 hypothetical protein [Bacillota bacterium]MDD4791785.1 hypothetical protein [Bacillota bacterium]
MVRVALAAFRLACVAALYMFLYYVCRALVLDASIDGRSHYTCVQQLFKDPSAADLPDVDVDDIV